APLGDTIAGTAPWPAGPAPPAFGTAKTAASTAICLAMAPPPRLTGSPGSSRRVCGNRCSLAVLGDPVMFDSAPDHHDTVSFAPGGSAAAPGRPSWSGLLQLSLVGIPLKAYPAVRSRTVPSCHQLHQGCGQRIRYAKHCPVHGDVDAAAIVRGY